VRDNERHLFVERRPVATKIILPVDPPRLQLGGSSFMLGERIAERILCERLGLDRRSPDPRVKRDLMILDVLDSLATLDPFVVRERLALEDIRLPEILVTSQIQIEHGVSDYVRSRLSPLGKATIERHKLEHLLDHILAGTRDDHSELLRQTFEIPADSWGRAVDVWRSALYYEYKALQFAPRWRRFADEVQCAKLRWFSAKASQEEVMRLRAQLAGCVAKTKWELDELLVTFNQAYREQLLGHGSLKALGQHLMSLNAALYNFGTAYGVLQQFVDYWEYWAVIRGMTPMPAHLYMSICQDLVEAVAGETCYV
jgi:hypothetical protein